MPKLNILIIMSDEHAPMFSSAYGHPIVQTPNMERLAAAGATFDAAYCNSPLDGDSLLPLLTGRESNWKDEVFCEYLAHGTDRPMAMLRRGRFKLNYSWGEPVELYDLEADPGEFHDLASCADYHDLAADMKARLLADWNPAALDQQVRASQRRQNFIEDRFGTGWRASTPPNTPSFLAKSTAHR